MCYSVVTVLLQGVLSIGLVDTGADITIIGGELFKRVAAKARLKKWDFKRADKTPKMYDQRSFTLDGRLDLDIEFHNKVLHNPVYVKMDLPNQLLLSESITVPVQVERESVCPQLLDCFAEDMCIQMEDALVQPTPEGTAFVTLSNPHGY